MTLEEAVAVGERLEREDCIGTTSLALRAVLKAYKESERYAKLAEEHSYNKLMGG